MVFLFRLISRSRNIYHSLPTSFNHSRPGASEKLSNTNIACLYILTAYTILVNRGNSLCRYNDTSLKIVQWSQLLIDIKSMIICIIHYLFDLIQGSFLQTSNYNFSQDWKSQASLSGPPAEVPPTHCRPLQAAAAAALFSLNTSSLLHSLH